MPREYNIVNYYKHVSYNNLKVYILTLIQYYACSIENNCNMN